MSIRLLTLVTFTAKTSSVDFLIALYLGKTKKMEKIHNTETTFADYFAETEIVFFRVVFANKGSW